ncbi:MAG: hypothetical protein WA708_04470, partial [Acidobacteriaceae bacterium]
KPSGGASGAAGDNADLLAGFRALNLPDFQMPSVVGPDGTTAPDTSFRMPNMVPGLSPFMMQPVMGPNGQITPGGPDFTMPGDGSSSDASTVGGNASQKASDQTTKAQLPAWRKDLAGLIDAGTEALTGVDPSKGLAGVLGSSLKAGNNSQGGSAPLSSFLQWIHKKSVDSNANAFFSGEDDMMDFGGGMASGGPVSDNMTYLIGEQGPELFTPGARGNITPNHILKNMSSGGDTYHFHHTHNVDARGSNDPAQVVAAMDRYMKTAGPNIAAAAVKSMHETKMRSSNMSK